MKKVGNRSLICRDARPAPWGRKKVCPAPKREASPRPALWKLPRPTGQSWFQSIEIQKAITRKGPNYQSIYARFCPASQIFTLAPPAVKKVRPVLPCWYAITWPGPKISSLFGRSDLPWVLWHGLALVAVEKHQVLKDLGWISDDLRESTASLLQHLPFSILIRTVDESQNESANHREVAAEWKSQSIFRN